MPLKLIPCIFHIEIYATLKGGITVRYLGRSEVVGVQFITKALRRDHTQDIESMKSSR